MYLTKDGEHGSARQEEKRKIIGRTDGRSVCEASCCWSTFAALRSVTICGGMKMQLALASKQVQ